MSIRKTRMYQIRKKHLPKRKRTFVRLYGRFETMMGKRKGFEFQVRVGDRVSKRALYHYITSVSGKMKHERLMPCHKRRETFPTFHALLATPWVRIRKILDYDIKVEYPTPFD